MWLTCALVLLSMLAACSGADAPAPRSPSEEVDRTDDGPTLNPYHAVVRGKVLGAFRGLSAHDAGPALDLMADDVTYTFEGEGHALSGTRVSKRGVEKWFGRLFRLLPGAFVVTGVDVSGFPWSTRVVTRFLHRVDPPGEPTYYGRGVQIVDLAWGKASTIHTYLDTDRLVRTLDTMAKAGVDEAKAAPILE